MKTHDEIENIYKANAGAGHGAALDAVFHAGVSDAEAAAGAAKVAIRPAAAPPPTSQSKYPPAPAAPVVMTATAPKAPPSGTPIQK